MQIAVHGVASPATENPNAVWIYPTKEQCHGLTRAQGSSGDIIRAKAGVTRDSEGSSAENRGDHGGCDAMWSTVGIVTVKRSGGRGLM